MEKRTEYLKNMVLCALFVALIIVGTFIKIPSPLVPFTLQLLFTNLAGIMLGKKWGTASVAIYVLMGLLGLPIFTAGGGISYVLKPSFGYIIGFIFGAFVAGLIVEKTKHTFINIFLASLANLVIVYVIGLVYFYCLSNYYLHSPISVGVLMVQCCLLLLPSDIILSALSAVLAKKLLPILEKKK